jgi:hypothetical protein
MICHRDSQRAQALGLRLLNIVGIVENFGTTRV